MRSDNHEAISAAAHEAGRECLPYHLRRMCCRMGTPTTGHRLPKNSSNILQCEAVGRRRGQLARPKLTDQRLCSCGWTGFKRPRQPPSRCPSCDRSDRPPQLVQHEIERVKPHWCSICTSYIDFTRQKSAAGLHAT